MSVKETLLKDVSKAFDCFDHKLLTAKLNACSFNLPAIRLIHDYLSNRKQRIKIYHLDGNCILSYAMFNIETTYCSIYFWLVYFL